MSLYEALKAYRIKSFVDSIGDRQARISVHTLALASLLRQRIRAVVTMAAMVSKVFDFRRLDIYPLNFRNRALRDALFYTWVERGPL